MQDAACDELGVDPIEIEPGSAAAMPDEPKVVLLGLQATTGGAEAAAEQVAAQVSLHLTFEDAADAAALLTATAKTAQKRGRGSQD